MHYKQIVRTGPSGCVERPWRNRSHQFVLGDPKQGSVKHHSENAIMVDGYGEALELVEEGYAIRMSDGRNPPSLVTAGSLTLLDEPFSELDALWTYTAPLAPHPLTAVMDELRSALLAEAMAIASFASINAARQFLNVDAERGDGFHEMQATDVELDAFSVTRIVRNAYEYAYGGRPGLLLSDELADQLEVFLERASRATTNHFCNPMHNEHSYIRMTLEMAYARWQLKKSPDLPVSRMAFLARMTETAARNSLSNQKIRPIDGLVPFKEAMAWLEARQGFVPLREFEKPGAAMIFDLLHEMESVRSDEPLARAIANLTQRKDCISDDCRALVQSITAKVDAAVAAKQLRVVSDLRAIARILNMPIDGSVFVIFEYFEKRMNANLSD